jgi:2-keto-3-deoxy-L-rhamnonate aldolase RhmA
VGDFPHPDVVEAIARIEQAARRARVALGTISRTWEEARALYARGYQLVTLASDAGLLTQHAAAMARQFTERREV